MKLSIIIPYYDTYELTKILLTELQRQFVDGVEIILVDDGCNETRLDAFDFLKIIHLDKNYGASHAWNVGLAVATGDYIGFIDSDDMIASDYISTLLDAIDKEHADEIVFRFYSCSKCNKFLSVKNINCRAIWKAVYKRWLVPQFDETRMYNTDVPFKKHLDSTPHTKFFIDKPLYYYTVGRKNSITWKRLHGLF